MSIESCNWNREGELDCHREDEESQQPERLRNLSITYSDAERVGKWPEKMKSHHDDQIESSKLWRISDQNLDQGSKFSPKINVLRIASKQTRE
jgi:hypothetical protein